MLSDAFRLASSALVACVALGCTPRGSGLETAAASEAKLDVFDFADPFVTRDGGDFLAFATGGRGKNLQVAESSDLLGWRLLDDPLPELPAWAAKAPGFTWAPAVLAQGDHFVLYYAAADTGSGFQCISRAIAASLRGPYRDDSARPLVCQAAAGTPRCGSIDPSPFTDADGSRYLLWKSDENSPRCNAPPHIWSQRLSDDALSLIGEPSALLVRDAAWEGRIIEAPSLVQLGGHYLLFYSANWYDGANYAIGYAECAGPSGPCQKRTRAEPWLASAGPMLGPGGQETFSDGAGGTLFAFHAWTSPHAGYAAGGARALRFGRLALRAHDLPELDELPLPRLASRAENLRH